MEIKLDSLIEKIKEDGILEAKKVSEEITEEAKAKAQAIIDKAELKAGEIIKAAEKEAEKLKSNVKAGLKQASRDLTLAVKEQIEVLFNKALKNKLTQELTPAFLKDLLVKIIGKWSPGESFEVVVSEEDKKKLKELVVSEVKKKIKGTIEIKVNSNINKGLRVGLKGKDIYYDFTDESILEALKSFLNPAISAMLDTKDG